MRKVFLPSYACSSGRLFFNARLRRPALHVFLVSISDISTLCMLNGLSPEYRLATHVKFGPNKAEPSVKTEQYRTEHCPTRNAAEQYRTEGSALKTPEHARNRPNNTEPNISANSYRTIPNRTWSCPRLAPNRTIGSVKNRRFGQNRRFGPPLVRTPSRLFMRVDEIPL